MIPQALAVPHFHPPPSILPFLASFFVVILVFISIIIFSILASFAIIVFIYIFCQYLIGWTNSDDDDPDLEAGLRNENQIARTMIFLSHQMRHGGYVEQFESNVWREALEVTTAERKRLKEQNVEKMAMMVSYGSCEAAAKCIDCAICLEDFENGERCQIFPVCKHIFHYSCIQSWLKMNLTCPICRCSIVNEMCLDL